VEDVPGILFPVVTSLKAVQFPVCDDWAGVVEAGLAHGCTEAVGGIHVAVAPSAEPFMRPLACSGKLRAVFLLVEPEFARREIHRLEAARRSRVAAGAWLCGILLRCSLLRSPLLTQQSGFDRWPMEQDATTAEADAGNFAGHSPGEQSATADGQPLQQLLFPNKTRLARRGCFLLVIFHAGASLPELARSFSEKSRSDCFPVFLNSLANSFSESDEMSFPGD
jgi:hypothetical protein